MLEALAGARLLRAAGFRPSLQRVRDVLALVAALCTLVCAAISLLSLRLGGDVDAGQAASVWRTWWLSDFCGVVLVTPTLLVLGTARRPLGSATARLSRPTCRPRGALARPAPGARRAAS